MDPMCLKRSVPAMAGATFVVSDRGDILSPKKAPEAMAPAVMADGTPRPSPMLIRARPTVPIVPNEVPVARDVMQQITKVTGRNISG